MDNYLTAVKRYKKAALSVPALDEQLRNINIQHEKLEADRRQSNELAARQLEKVKELAASFRPMTVVQDPTITSDKPVYPKKKDFLILSFFSSLIVAAAAVYLDLFFRHSRR